MRRGWLLLLALFLLSNTGCFVQQYDYDPAVRAQELLYESENLRQIRGEWRRWWMLDMPSHLSWERVDGGIGP